MSGRLGSLLRKEFRQLVRDPVLMILIIWLYTVEVIICAYALSFDLHETPLAVVDLDGTPASRSVVDRMDRSRYFRVVTHRTEAAELSPLLDREEAVVALHIPSGWTRHLYRGEEASVQVLVDGSNATMAAAVRGYAQQMLMRYAAEAASGPEMKDFAEVENRTRIWYNAELRYVYFMVISMIALAGFMVGVIHPAAAVVREKEMGTLEQILVSPIRASELILAKVIPTLAVGLVGLTLSLGVLFWFEVPMGGSLLLFYAISIIFMVSSMGIGVLIATFSNNLQQALLLSFFGLFPVMFLSGTIVPIESMPRAVQIASLASPLRYYMESLLGLLLKGNGLIILWPQMAAMGGLAVIIFGLSLLRFRRQVA